LAPDTTRVQFTNNLPIARIKPNVNLMNGSGVALGDFDGDGWCDIYFCNLTGPNALFRNLGNWTFENVTEATGTACSQQTSTGAAFADLNGDGHLDLLVNSMGGPNACLMNDGQGRFTDTTEAAGLASQWGSSSLALADIEGDGDLDLYVANYGKDSVLRSGGGLSWRMVNGKPVVTGRYRQRLRIVDGVLYELGEPDQLYRNDGKGQFTPVSWTDGSFLDRRGQPLDAAPWDQGLSVLFRDINGDSSPDIYVCNDAATPDQCWINDGSGKFRRLSFLSLRKTSHFSMNADFADADRNGSYDLLIADMLSHDHSRRMTQKGTTHSPDPGIGEIDSQPQYRRNMLLLARGDSTFMETAYHSGLADSDWTWSVIFLDVDLDGWEDVLVANGFLFDLDDRDSQELKRRMGQMSVGQSREFLLRFPQLDTSNLAFRNEGNLTFREVGTLWGWNSLRVSNGMALGDLDNDGDLDVAVNCMNESALVYRNRATAPRVAVRLEGSRGNTQGIGANIRLLGGPVTQSQEVICGGRYVSGDDPMRVFAASTEDGNAMTIEVTWRNGKQSLVRGVEPNHVYCISESEAVEPEARQGPITEPSTFFTEVSHLVGHSHTETPFEDLARQPSLPYRLSQMGPGVGWLDLDQDGWEDLIVGSGKGGRLGIYRNLKGAGFEALASPLSARETARDQTAVVGWESNAGECSMWIGSSNYETNAPAAADPVAELFNLSKGQRGASLPSGRSSTGPMAMADIDGDEDLDLFIGGRCVPGRYPEPAASMVLLNDDGRFTADTKNRGLLTRVGMVSGAVFSDLDADGDPDLILACDWGNVRILRNDGGVLSDQTENLGLTNYLGWWNGVNTGDFNGDGRLDIVASNWGRNTRRELYRGAPVRLYYGDVDGNGVVEILETYLEAKTERWLPQHDLTLVEKAFPFIRVHFPTHAAFAKASAQELLGTTLPQMKTVEANTFDSMIFLNEGDRFKALPLPWRAQMSPAFAVAVSDYNGDGKEDVFLSQNFFAMIPRTDRYDAGRGVWLKGDGQGGFSAISGNLSGIKVYGEQRGAALADWNKDGRVDLVVTQNGAPTKLFKNTGGKPGLRVRLTYLPGNIRAVGAVMRLEFGGRQGPAREIHSGAGYWSLDSFIQVLGYREEPSSIWVRWPGGSSTRTRISPGAQEIEVEFD
jgi:hypothetical protein